MDMDYLEKLTNTVRRLEPVEWLSSVQCLSHCCIGYIDKYVKLQARKEVVNKICFMANRI